jgi:hypothetical protein
MVMYVQRLPKADKQNWLLKALFWRLGCGDKENGVSFLQSAAQPSATEKHQPELASKSPNLMLDQLLFERRFHPQATSSKR